MVHPRVHLRALFAAATLVLLAAAVLASAAPAGATAARRTRARTRHTTRAVARPATAVLQPGQVAGAQGMVVGIDPATGRLGMPSPEDMLQLTPTEKTGLLRSSEGLTPVRLPDGTVKLDLQGRFMEFSVLRLDSAGRPRITCVEDPRVAAAGKTPVGASPAPAHEVK